MGLHWDPPEGAAADPADLDALCVLFDAQGRVLEAVHPGRPRSADGGVVHTGDSRNGANHWDDERIFVFLEALPDDVAKLALLVASASGHAFHEVRGAVCHVSDNASDLEWLRLDLTALQGERAHTVATLHRAAAGWRIDADQQAGAN
ncbi:MAG: TerD family protein [Betaproteobacteria bacterium]|nr:TerD family protein [Betaproteobacteria bacterium]